MDTAAWLISSVIGIGGGLVYAIIHLLYVRFFTAKTRPAHPTDCFQLHQLAADEKTIYKKIISPEVAEHVAECDRWAIAPHPNYGWKVVAAPVGEVLRIEYLCEHVWDKDGVCLKCAVDKAEAYRLPAIFNEDKKDFRRPA